MSSRRPSRVSIEGALFSCTDTIPRRAAASRAVRYMAVRRSGLRSRAASRALWCASSVTQPVSVHPRCPSSPALRARDVETTAECTSTRAA